MFASLNESESSISSVRARRRCGSARNLDLDSDWSCFARENVFEYEGDWDGNYGTGEIYGNFFSL